MAAYLVGSVDLRLVERLRVFDGFRRR